MAMQDTYTPPRDDFTTDEAPGYPDNGTKLSGRKDDPFNGQCSLEDLAKKYPNDKGKK